jgi:hypothetical protein
MGWGNFCSKIPRAMQKHLIVLTAALVAANIACSVENQKPPEKQDAPCAARFVPTGNDPDIALDTQTGTLCKTVPNTTNHAYESLPACNAGGGFAAWKKSQEGQKKWNAIKGVYE